MAQGSFWPDWTPKIEPMTAPFQGHTPTAREASKSGADCANETRSANIAALRQLYREPKTRQEIAAITGLPINSVCSLTDALAEELEFVDFEFIDWGEGRKTTKRERLRLKRRDI